jgi:hypothetical protein
MKDPNFIELKKGIANETAFVPGAKIRLVQRSIPGGITFSVLAGNCFWADGTREHAERRFAELTA